jgi:hypothetical protein
MLPHSTRPRCGHGHRCLAEAAVGLHLKDDLSGIVYYQIDYRSPSDAKSVDWSQYVQPPATRLNPTVTLGVPYFFSEFSVFTEPGTWRAYQLLLRDAAGNSRTYTESELAALGSVTFTVTNDGGYDIVGPAIVSGTITTPGIQLSKAPKGTQPGTLPYAGAELKVTDSGEGAVSGTNQVALAFCLPNGNEGCVDSFVLGGNTTRPGRPADSVTIGQQMRAGLTPGQYLISSLTMSDLAGNYSFYYSTVFGGSTNFAALFPAGTSITVNP